MKSKVKVNIDELLIEEEKKILDRWKEAQKYAKVAEKEIAFNDDYEKALEYYTKAIALNPKNAEYYVSRAMCYKDSEIDKRIEDLKIAIKLTTLNERYYGIIRGVYFDAGEYKKTLEYTDKLIERYSERLAGNYLSKGEIYERMGKYDKALSEYEKVLSLSEKVLSLSNNNYFIKQAQEHIRKIKEK